MPGRHTWTQLAFLLLLVGLSGCGASAPAGVSLAAAASGDTAALRSWIASGGDVNRPGDRRLTPLVVAARNGRGEAIRLLVAAGADPNLAAGSKGWTPLIHAVHSDQNAAVLALLSLGANPNIPGDGGVTPLTMAASYGNAETVRYLLDFGADPNRKTAQGITPLSAALEGSIELDRFTAGRCHADVVREILRADPAASLSDRPSRSGLWVARLGGCFDAVDLVLHRAR